MYIYGDEALRRTGLGALAQHLNNASAVGFLHRCARACVAMCENKICPSALAQGRPALVALDGPSLTVMKSFTKLGLDSGASWHVPPQIAMMQVQHSVR